MSRLTTIDLHKESMKFSAGHFTILSPKKRERLHGHNFSVHASITASIDENTGMAFDYRFYKKKLNQLCLQLNESFLLPAKSPYAKLVDQNDRYLIEFNQEEIPFLKADVTVLPIKNITVEELSAWFIEQLVQDEASWREYDVRAITVKVFTGPGQSGSCTWERS